MTTSQASVPSPDAPKGGIPRWRQIVARYHAPSVPRSVLQLLNTLVPLFAVFGAMYLLMRVHYLLALPLAVLGAGFLIRTFIIMHDCGHGSFFKSRRANDIVGFFTGVLTLTPYTQWRRDHAIHHATSGDLDERGFGDVGTLTVSEYLQLNWFERLRYRVYRNGVVMLTIGPIWLLAKHRVPNPGSAGRREILGVHLTNLTIVLLFLATSLVIGPLAVVAIYVPAMLLAAAAGIWLFYVQHQFEDAYWERGREWDYATAAVQGSSFYRLPGVLNWITGSIGFHHVHHLSPRIPNYLLRRAHNENQLFHAAPTLTLRQSIGTFRLKLWDEESRRLIGWKELRGRIDG